MRVWIKWVVIVVGLVALSSCYRHDVSYPKKMVFPAEGGNVIKDFSLIDFEITDYKGNTVVLDSIGQKESLDWLTVELISETQSEITVSSNDERKYRRLFLNRFENPGYTEIMVMQLR